LHIISRKSWYSMQTKSWWWAIPKIAKIWCSSNIHVSQCESKPRLRYSSHSELTLFVQERPFSSDRNVEKRRLHGPPSGLRPQCSLLTLPRPTRLCPGKEQLRNNSVTVHLPVVNWSQIIENAAKPCFLSEINLRHVWRSSQTKLLGSTGIWTSALAVQGQHHTTWELGWGARFLIDVESRTLWLPSWKTWMTAEKKLSCAIFKKRKPQQVSKWLVIILQCQSAWNEAIKTISRSYRYSLWAEDWMDHLLSLAVLPLTPSCHQMTVAYINVTSHNQSFHCH